eukprot:TRINITY_DN8602_c0_g1_i4.p1 TRINITY_DN8602_c0_g1~~TRINITY_DN8602_c0_g1_i4.p1  ORF type:complete len:524 (+),score=192.07 TRINITY_DN8602_c0_g1_i4:1296-2867(+)
MQAPSPRAASPPSPTKSQRSYIMSLSPNDFPTVALDNPNFPSYRPPSAPPSSASPPASSSSSPSSMPPSSKMKSTSTSNLKDRLANKLEQGKSKLEQGKSKLDSGLSSGIANTRNLFASVSKMERPKPEKSSSSSSFEPMPPSPRSQNSQGSYIAPSTSQFVEEEIPEVPELSIPQRVIAYQSGELLDLSGQQLSEIPSIVSEKLTSWLSDLCVSFNNFTIVPNLAMFTNLAVLDLSGNRLVQVGPHLETLTNLRELFLNGNNLNQLSQEISPLTKLEKLRLENNDLSAFPMGITNLKKLEELSLSGNTITTLPKEIGYCASMEIIELDGCKLKSLPEEFCLMTRLLELNLGFNMIGELPSQLGRMTRLTRLNLADNKLSDLPMSLGHCIALGKLGSGINITRNPIESSEMMAKFEIGPDHLLDFLEKRMSLNSYQLPPAPKLPDLNAPKVTAPSPAEKIAEAEKRAELAKKVTALSSWGDTCASNLKSDVINLKREIQAQNSVGQARPLFVKLENVFLVVSS